MQCGSTRIRAAAALLFSVVGVVPLSAASSLEQHSPPARKKTWITIFIHGTFITKVNHLFSRLGTLFADRLLDTLYACTTAISRRNPAFYKNQAMQETGLRRITMDPAVPCPNGATMLATVFDVLEQQVAPADEHDIERRYYTFGWSGLLSAKAREQESRNLYCQLKSELRRLRSEGLDPQVRIVGYSHGGTVALQLGRWCEPGDGVIVDELVLLGTPIYLATESMLNRDVFKQVYNIFSAADRIQQLDCFSGRFEFARRRFFRPDGCPALIQLQLGVKPTSPSYSTDISPGHVELWFFGWTPHFYRRNFPLYPAPCAAFIPLLIGAARSYCCCDCAERSEDGHLIANIYPARGDILLSHSRRPRDTRRYPFINQRALKRLSCLFPHYDKRAYRAEYKESQREAFWQSLYLYRCAD